MVAVLGIKGPSKKVRSENTVVSLGFGQLQDIKDMEKEERCRTAKGERDQYLKHREGGELKV